MDPLLYTTPVGKAAYLRGRFLAAFVLYAVILLAVPLGLLLAAVVPGPEAELIGPFRPAAYLGAYLFLAAAERLRRDGVPVFDGGAQPARHGELPRRSAPLQRGRLQPGVRGRDVGVVGAGEAAGSLRR